MDPASFSPLPLPRLGRSKRAVYFIVFWAFWGQEVGMLSRVRVMEKEGRCKSRLDHSNMGLGSEGVIDTGVLEGGSRMDEVLGVLEGVWKLAE